jgi:alanine racemase
MDLTIVDVSHIRGVAVGDEVVLIGKDLSKDVGKVAGEGCGKSVDAVELARWCESVPYEILCGLSQRVPRVYS